MDKQGARNISSSSPPSSDFETLVEFSSVRAATLEATERGFRRLSDFAFASYRSGRVTHFHTTRGIFLLHSKEWRNRPKRVSEVVIRFSDMYRSPKRAFFRIIVHH